MARWTDIATWVGPSSHRYPGGMMAGGRSHGLVLHIASGFYDGTIAWQKNPAGDTSSHWIVARDGRIAQMLDTTDGSWAQITGNKTWHSVEFEGFAVGDPQHRNYPGWEKLTDAQVQAAAVLLARGHRDLGWPLQLASSPTGTGLGHHSMGTPGWGHASCPGDPVIAQKAAILARAVQIAGGNTPNVVTGTARKDRQMISINLAPGESHAWTPQTVYGGQGGLYLGAVNSDCQVKVATCTAKGWNYAGTDVTPKTIKAGPASVEQLRVTDTSVRMIRVENVGPGLLVLDWFPVEAMTG